MLDYTKAAIQKTVDDFKKLMYVIEFLSQIIYIAYLAYTLFTATDFFIVNLILLLISTLYFIFFLYVTRGKYNYVENKKIKKRAKRVYNHTKKVLKLYTLGVTIYGFFLTSKHVTIFSLGFMVMMVVGWVLGLVFEIISSIIENRVGLVLSGLEADWQQVIKPAKAVGNFFKKVTGKEVEPEPEPSKNRILLEKRVAENKAKELLEKQGKITKKKKQKVEQAE